MNPEMRRRQVSGGRRRAARYRSREAFAKGGAGNEARPFRERFGRPFLRESMATMVAAAGTGGSGARTRHTVVRVVGGRALGFVWAAAAELQGLERLLEVAPLGLRE